MSNNQTGTPVDTVMVPMPGVDGLVKFNVFMTSSGCGECAGSKDLSVCFSLPSCFYHNMINGPHKIFVEVTDEQ